MRVDPGSDSSYWYEDVESYFSEEDCSIYSSFEERNDSRKEKAYCVIRPVEPPSSVGRRTSLKCRCFKHRLLSVLLFCIKVRLKQKLSVIGPFAPRRMEILCGLLASFRIPAFISLERAEMPLTFSVVLCHLDPQLLVH